jgi:hypothetical protein
MDDERDNIGTPIAFLDSRDTITLRLAHLESRQRAMALISLSDWLDRHGDRRDLAPDSGRLDFVLLSESGPAPALTASLTRRKPPRKRWEVLLRRVMLRFGAPGAR